MELRAERREDRAAVRELHLAAVGDHGRVVADPAFQSIRLPAYRPGITGTLVYSKTFWRHDVVGLREPNA